MIDFESPSARTLLTLAGGRSGIDAARCSRVFAHLGSAGRLRRRLRRALARHRLSDLQFAILVLLFAAEPELVPMAVLARHAGVSRPAVPDAFYGLDASGFASRTRDRGDRRSIHGRSTAAGREKVDNAIDDYLHAIALYAEKSTPRGWAAFRRGSAMPIASAVARGLARPVGLLSKSPD